MNLLDIGFRLLAIVGLGLFPIINITTPIASGGELYQRTLYTSREFTLAGYLEGNTRLQINNQRNDLMTLLNPFNQTGAQYPLTLTYHQLDSDGTETDTLDLQTSYKSGLDGVIDNLHQERVGLVFTQYMPYIVSRFGYVRMINNHTNIDPDGGTSLTPAVVSRDYTGMWKNMYSDILPVIGDLAPTINDMTVGNDGTLYMAGRFTNAGGTDQHIMKFDAATNSFVALGAGIGADDTVNTLMFDAQSNRLYIGGKFTDLDSVSGTSRIGYFDVATGVYVPLGTGALDGSVYDLASWRDPTTGIFTLYATGSFTQMGGVAGTPYFAKWDAGNGWQTFSAPLTGVAYPVEVDSAGNIFVGGSFTDGANKVNIVKYDLAGVQTAMGTGLYGGPVFALAFDSQGNLWAGGQFYGGIGIWNGAAWKAPSFLADLKPAWNGIGLPPPPVPPNVRKIIVDPISKDVYVFMPQLYVDTTCYTWVYNGNSFHPLDFYTGDGYFRPLMFHPSTNDLYGTIDEPLTPSLAAYSVSYIRKVNNPNPTVAYPVLTVKGPVSFIYSIVNYTTGKAIYFNGLGVSLNEQVYIIPSPTGGISVYSSIRGYINQFITSDSDANFFLSPGDNYISIVDKGAAQFTNPTTVVLPDAVFYGADLTNTDNGRLYVKYTRTTGATGNIEFFTDAARTVMVSNAHGVYAPALIRTRSMETSSSGLVADLTVNLVSDPASSSAIVVDLAIYNFVIERQYKSIDEATK